MNDSSPAQSGTIDGTFGDGTSGNYDHSGAALVRIGREIETMLAQSAQLTHEVLQDKYLLEGETKAEDMFARVVTALYPKPEESGDRQLALDCLSRRDFVPAGRIMAGAGAGRKVTLINCFVGGRIRDSLRGIMTSIGHAAMTLQSGGGHGSDFSPIRPAGAYVGRTGSIASGVLPFADTQDATCGTIMSAGSRRGAMMMTLQDDHPDLWNDEQFERWTAEEAQANFVRAGALKRPSFISAKQEAGRLTNFNISVLISDAFMEAVENDHDWEFGHWVKPAGFEPLAVRERIVPYDLLMDDEDDDTLGRTLPEPLYKAGERRPWYVYRRARARQVWNDILKSTYDYAEPGVIFIDTVNKQNNLAYCEYITASNPCGEQMLPPHGACDLGAVNLANMVYEEKWFPRWPEASTPERRVEAAFVAIDWRRLRTSVRIGMRLLDNVLDTTLWPLKAQEEEGLHKRRTGLGVMGLGDFLAFLGLRYGSPESVEIVEKVMQFIAVEAYRVSCELARERGAFPAFDCEEYLKRPFVQKIIAVAPEVGEAIRTDGIRNGLLLTCAPTGTSAIVTWNVSSGLEPIFALEMRRKVLQPDGTKKLYTGLDYAWSCYIARHGRPEPDASGNFIGLPDYFATALTLSVADHLAIPVAAQKWIDASISKTVNCPADMSFDEFAAVYTQAYRGGLKGCTTYRPSLTRGSVLEVARSKEAGGKEAEGKAELKTAAQVVPVRRPQTLTGETIAFQWTSGSKIYLTINRLLGRPFEIFHKSKDLTHAAYMSAITLLLTQLLKLGIPLEKILLDLEEIKDEHGGWVPDPDHRLGSDPGRVSVYVPSEPALLAKALRHQFVIAGSLPDHRLEELAGEAHLGGQPPGGQPFGKTCPKCKAPALHGQEGCEQCTECSYSKCG
jgi:ribonucleoside-diphosphate reductase alpha chain